MARGLVSCNTYYWMQARGLCVESCNGPHEGVLYFPNVKLLEPEDAHRDAVANYGWSADRVLAAVVAPKLKPWHLRIENKGIIDPRLRIYLYGSKCVTC